MTKLRNALSASVLALACTFFMSSAYAVNLQDNSVPNVVPLCYADITANPTATTTTATDVTGLTCTFIPQKYDGTVAANPGGADLIKLTYSISANKATAGYGVYQVNLNGALVADTLRTVSTTGIGTPTIGGTFIIPETVAGSQTIKLQMWSSDTNTVTTAQGHFYVEEISRASLKN